MSTSAGEASPQTPCRIIRIAFSDPDEFLRELQERGPNVEPVLRATLQWSLDETGAPYHHLSIVATYLRRVAADLVVVAELRRYIGPVWSGVDDSASRRHRQRAGQVLSTIEHAARAAGLTPARGLYDAAAGPACSGGNEAGGLPAPARGSAGEG